VLRAQTVSGSFEIISNGTAENPSAYVTAIQHADFESYRLLGERVRLSFDNGLTFELLSVYELAGAGFTLSTSDYRSENPPGYTAPVFHLAPNGMIAAEYEHKQPTKF
jgi:hypothetical protein